MAPNDPADSTRARRVSTEEPPKRCGLATDSRANASRSREEEGRAISLSRPRQAIGDKGEIRTVLGLLRAPTPSSGFEMLKQRDPLELSFQALVIAREKHFSGTTWSTLLAPVSGGLAWTSDRPIRNGWTAEWSEPR